MKKLFSIPLAMIVLATLLALSCKKGDVGPQGPRGETGEAGPRGATGANGNLILSGAGAPAESLGAVGDYYLNITNATLYGPKTGAGWGKASNLQGPRGATGAQGPKGDRGEAGARGATGAQGPKGETGATGPRGATGAQGPKGDRGEAGARGATGAQGPKGETGATGPRGATGAQGPKGDRGEAGARGATGAQGEAGSQILSGSASPTVAVGRNGDYYFQTTTGALFGPKTNAGWGAGIALRGVRGPKGDKGDKGDPGTANVIYSEWIKAEWVVFNSKLRTFQMVGAQLINAPATSSVRVYMRFGGETANYPLPYTEFLSDGTMDASYSFGSSYISVRLAGTGVDVDPFRYAEVYFRYVIIPGGVAAAAQAGGVDLQNFEAVSNAFDIPLN